MAEAMVIESVRPLAAVLVSAIAVGLILAARNHPNIREGWSIIAALTKFGIVASMIPGVLAGYEYRW